MRSQGDVTVGKGNTTHNVTLLSTAIARFRLLLHRAVTRYVTFHAACAIAACTTND